MEDSQLTTEELGSFTEQVERIMRDTVTRLREMLDKTDRQLQSAGRDTSKSPPPAADGAHPGGGVGGGRVAPLPPVEGAVENV